MNMDITTSKEGKSQCHEYRRIHMRNFFLWKFEMIFLLCVNKLWSLISKVDRTTNDKDDWDDYDNIICM